MASQWSWPPTTTEHPDSYTTNHQTHSNFLHPSQNQTLITPQHQRLRTPTMEQVAFTRESHRFKTTGGGSDTSFKPRFPFTPMFEPTSSSSSSSPAIGSTPLTMPDHEIFGAPGYVSPPTSIPTCATSRHTPGTTSTATTTTTTTTTTTPPSTPSRRYRPSVTDFARPRQAKYRKSLTLKLPFTQTSDHASCDPFAESDSPVYNDPDSPLTYKQYNTIISRYCSPGRSRNSSLRMASRIVRKQLAIQTATPALHMGGEDWSDTGAHVCGLPAPWAEQISSGREKRKALEELAGDSNTASGSEIEIEGIESAPGNWSSKRRCTEKDLDPFLSRDVEMEWE